MFEICIMGYHVDVYHGMLVIGSLLCFISLSPEYGMMDIITYGKFYANQFKSFGVLTPFYPFYNGLAGHSYNNATMLHCDGILRTFISFL